MTQQRSTMPGTVVPKVAVSISTLFAALVVFSVTATAGRAVAAPRPKGNAARAPELAEADHLTAAYGDAYRRGAFARAESLAIRQVEIRKAHLGPRDLDVATSLLAQAEYSRALGEHERAEPASREALEIRLAALGPRHPDVAIARRDLARTLLGAGRLTEAEAQCRQALEVQRELLGKSDTETLVSECLLGTTLLKRWRPEAKEQLRSAYEGLHAAPGNAADLRLNRATCALGQVESLAQAGDVVQAEALVNEALKTRREVLGESHPEYAGALTSLANVEVKLDRMARAVELEKESYEILRRALGPENRLAVEQMGEIGWSLSGSFQTPERMPSILEGEKWLRQAELLTRKSFGEHHAQYGSVLGYLGWNLVLQNRQHEADSLLIRAWQVRVGALGEDDAVASSIVSYRGRLAYQRRDFATAETLLRQRLAFVDRERGLMSRTGVSLYEGIGIMRAAQGDFGGAEQQLAWAAKAYENVRVRVGLGSTRASFWTSPYERLAAARLELGHESAAWDAVERLHGLAIADMLMATGERSLTATEKAHEDSLSTLLGDLENRLSGLRAAAVRDSFVRSEANDLHKQVMATEAEWNAFQAELEQGQSGAEARIFPLERVQRALDRSTAIVGWLEAEFALGDAKAWGYVVRDRGPVHWVRLPVASGPGWWSKPAQQYRDWIIQPSRSALGVAAPDTAQLARHLWDLRIAPLLPELAGAKHLVVIPSRGTRGVPFEALADARGELLSHRYTVQYVPSATIHAWLAERTAANITIAKGLLVGDPPFRDAHLVTTGRGEVAAADSVDDANAAVLRGVLHLEAGQASKLPRLRWSRREIESVAATMPASDQLLGSDASERALVQLVREHRLAQYDVLHFATHAIASDQSPEQSALVLAQVGPASSADGATAETRALDGLLSATEVLREWSLDADLVTLSACETADGQWTSEGTFGIAQAFLRVGARAALVSLWKVDDRATAMLMERFYANWLGANSSAAPRRPATSKAVALQDAKRWLREWRDPSGQRPFEHPYYWAGFVLIGDAS